MFGKTFSALAALAVAALFAACGSAGGGGSSDAVSAPSPDVAPTVVAASGEVGFDLGDRIPEFEITLTGGEALTSAQLRASERPAFLFFFSMT